MLHKVPQNIIISSIVVALGSLLFWFSAETIIIDWSNSTSIIQGAIGSQPLLNKSITLFNLVLIGFVVYRINKKHRFVEGNINSFLLFCVIGTVVSFIPMGSLFSGFSTLLAVSAMSVILQVYNQKSVLGLLFFAGLLTGIATLFFYPAITVVLVLLLTIAFFRPFEIRNYMVIVVGLVLPWFYYICLVYLLELPWSWPDWMIGKFDLKYFSWQYWLPLVLFLILAMAAVFKVFANRSKFIVRQRNQFLIISTFMIIQLLIAVLFQDYFSFASVVFFLAIFIQYLYKKLVRKWTTDLFALIILGVIFWLKL